MTAAKQAYTTMTAQHVRHTVAGSAAEAALLHMEHPRGIDPELAAKPLGGGGMYWMRGALCEFAVYDTAHDWGSAPELERGLAFDVWAGEEFLDRVAVFKHDAQDGEVS